MDKLTVPANDNAVQKKINEIIDGKQDTLTSGTNIKTINNESLLGNGNINISGGGTATDVQINGTTITANNVANIRTNGTYNTSSNKIATMSDIPTVNNATLTIQKNGTTVKTFTANASSNVTANITVPTKTSDISNDSGYLTGISSSDVTTALGYTPYNSSNPNGYTSNIGTVTSVNNVSPVNGNVSLSIPTVPTNISAFNNDSGYITGINSSDVTTALGYTPESTSNKVTSISSSSTDTQYPSAKSVVELLKTIYPVGAIFIGTTATCPMSALFGTWELVAEDRCLQGSSTNHSANTTVAAGLPNLEGSFGRTVRDIGAFGVFQVDSSDSWKNFGGSSSFLTKIIKMDASVPNSIYGNSTTVQPPAYVVNVWRRTA